MLEPECEINKVGLLQTGSEIGYIICHVPPLDWFVVGSLDIVHFILIVVLLLNIWEVYFIVDVSFM